MFHFPGCPPVKLWIHFTVTGDWPAGFPHSDIHGSMPAFGSPWLFADCCVLLRQLVPGHPPCALIRLISQAPSLPLPFLFESEPVPYFSEAFVDKLRFHKDLDKLYSVFRLFSVQFSRCVEVPFGPSKRYSELCQQALILFRNYRSFFASGLFVLPLAGLIRLSISRFPLRFFDFRPRVRWYLSTIVSP